MLEQEALGHNHNGLRTVTKEEMDARLKFVLSSDPRESDDFHRPLESYQDGKKSVPELVLLRHNDELDRLKKKYQNFFKFPQSPQFQSYLKQKERMQDDYKDQEDWVKIYSSKSEWASDLSHNFTRSMGMGVVFLSVGSTCASTAPAVTSLFYLGSMLSFYNAYCQRAELKEIPKEKERLKMILEDWHKRDRFARYDRSYLNEKLQLLDGKRPTQKRQDKKRDLVLQYRRNHPKSRAE